MITAAATLAGAAADPVTAPLVGAVRAGDVRAAAVVAVRARARVFDPTQVRQFSDHLIALVDPDRGEAEQDERLRRAERQAHALRELVIGPPGDGIVRGRFQLPTADAAVVRTALEALAKPHPADTGPTAATPPWPTSPCSADTTTAPSTPGTG